MVRTRKRRRKSKREMRRRSELKYYFGINFIILISY
jgi:hypothetical protein